MSWSLQVSNGDFALDQGGFGIVTGERKLIQDLRHFMLERMGTDDAHPNYGSLFDGGQRSDGTEVPSVIGHHDFAIASLTVESDIRRIVTEYQQTQLARARRERQRYNKTTFTAGEVIRSLDRVGLKQVRDTLYATLYITTASDVSIDLKIPVGNGQQPIFR